MTTEEFVDMAHRMRDCVKEGLLLPDEAKSLLTAAYKSCQYAEAGKLFPEHMENMRLKEQLRLEELRRTGKTKFDNPENNFA